MVLSDINHVGTDRGALGVLECSGAGQNDTVGVIVDHKGSGAYDASTDDSFAKIGDAARCETITEEESIETVETAQFIKCDLTVNDEPIRITPKSCVIEIYLLDSLRLCRARSGAEKLVEQSTSHVSKALHHFAIGELTNKFFGKLTDVVTLPGKHINGRTAADDIADFQKLVVVTVSSRSSFHVSDRSLYEQGIWEIFTPLRGESSRVSPEPIGKQLRRLPLPFQ